MTSLARFLSEDHADCDGFFAEAENAVSASNWNLAGTAFEAFHAATLRHFLREEIVLFPAFEAATGMVAGPTVVMRDEHDHMRVMLEAMAAALAGRGADAYLGHSETMLMLLRQHNLKEENILYPMAENAMNGQTAALVERMRELSADADSPA